MEDSTEDIPYYSDSVSQDSSYTPDDPMFMESLFFAESGGNQGAIGPENYTGERAIGIGQLLPSTFAEYAQEGEDINDETDNRAVSQRYLSFLYNKYKDPKLALAAYNAGPGTIDNYRKETETGSYDEVASLMAKNGAYQETRDYVPKVLGNYERERAKSGAAPDITIASGPKQSGTNSEFAESLVNEISSPGFDTLSAPEKVKTLAEIYGSKKWDADSYDTLKKATTSIWEGADPEELPNLGEVVGAPPIVTSDKDPDKALADWKTEAVQTLVKSGISPALFGQQLDTYLDNAAADEREAFTARNRTPTNWALNRAGNYLREGAKGAFHLATDAAAGAVRLTGAPLGAGRETADAIQNIPEVWLGTPAKDFMYVTDKEGYPVQNPDGTFQTHWQAQAAQGVGMIAGAISTLGAGAVFGVSNRVLAIANIGTNTLGMANHSFRSVYEKTGDVSKAYQAAAFTLPAAAIGSIGEIGIVAGSFRPALKSLSKYDQGRFIAKAFTRNALIGATANAGADITQQVGENLQTGEKLSPERTAFAAGIGAAGSGVAGTIFDVAASRSGGRARQTQIDEAGKSLAAFREDIRSELLMGVRPEDISKETQEFLGVVAEPAQNGTVVRKKSDIDPTELLGEEIPSLIKSLESYPTPLDLEALAARQGDVTDLSFYSRPEHLNNIKALEGAVNSKLQVDPGALSVRWSPEINKWENVETGEVHTFLKDALSTKEQAFKQDVSDISDVRILDEESATDAERKKFQKISEKGLGAIVTSKKGKEIIVPKGLTPKAREQVVAHEVAHAVTEKIAFTPEAKLAVQAALIKLKDQASVATAREIADTVLLPEVRPHVKIPENLTVEALDKPSRNALLSEREFLANQIGAVILKRAGKDIGDYQILPELQNALKEVNLPKLPAGEKLPTDAESIQGLQKVEDSFVVEPSSAPSTKQPVIEALTGQKRETAFSETVREIAPEVPPVFYDENSREGTFQASAAHIEKVGLRAGLDLLAKTDTSGLPAKVRLAYADALLAAADARYLDSGSIDDANFLLEAEQARAAAGTSGAQQLALGRRFRNSKTFSGVVADIKDAFRKAGLAPPEFTEFQLKELREAYKKTKGIPDGVLRDTLTINMFKKALVNKNIDWNDYLQSYIRANLLSGIGTFNINLVGGAWMGPLFTALSQPIVGKGIAWRAIKQIQPIARANAKRVLEGKPGLRLIGGLTEGVPLKVSDNSTLLRRGASAFQNQFGNRVYKALQASDAYMRTLADSSYLAVEKYKELRTKYADDPSKFTAEAAKILVSREDIHSAMAQADAEGKALGVDFSDADKAVRAYEIMVRENTSPELLEQAADWTDVVSLRGDTGNLIPTMFKGFVEASFWQKFPIARTVVLPFGKAMARLSDFTLDLVPGNILIDKAVRVFSGQEPRSAALEQRLLLGQKVGTAITASLFGAAMTGLLEITGDEEQVLDRGGEGDSVGKPAKTRPQFREFAQTGKPAYSFIFPGGTVLKYKDLPGLNAIAYGIYRAKKTLEAGTPLPYAAIEFFRNAYTYSLPVFGKGTLNSPFTRFIDEISQNELTISGLEKSLTELAPTVAKMLTPGSSLLSDIKKIYDETPEESNQALTVKLFKDVPGVSELLGSKPTLNRFGEPIVRSTLDRIPGAARIIEEIGTPSDEVARKLIAKGIIVPELPRTVKFNKGDFSSDTLRSKYQATREERLGKAYVNAFTPEEWYAFIKTTGPYVKRVAEQIAESGLPTDRAQKILIERVRAIENQAKKRYIRAGEF